LEPLPSDFVGSWVEGKVCALQPATADRALNRLAGTLNRLIAQKYADFGTDSGVLECKNHRLKARSAPGR
jgi:hypothetical protein